HNDLTSCVQQGSFRQDLYYRLNVISIHMPSLREMRDDVPVIAERLLERLRGDASVRFSAQALHELAGYDFPGNVRELENVIERALALCMDGVIQPDDLQLKPVQASQAEEQTGGAGRYPLTDYLDRVEREAILEALSQTDFNRTAAARILGVTFRALRYRMERLSITDKDKVD
ncbi:MAG: helix-turn-helix domain-containing protein, partial [Gallionellaceae bacterium]|nr:helix-turn-helix domain-containing protein [Gallionellaceae bacterium]